MIRALTGFQGEDFSSHLETICLLPGSVMDSSDRRALAESKTILTELRKLHATLCDTWGHHPIIARPNASHHGDGERPAALPGRIPSGAPSRTTLGTPSKFSLPWKTFTEMFKKSESKKPSKAEALRLIAECSYYANIATELERARESHPRGGVGDQRS